MTASASSSSAASSTSSGLGPRVDLGLPRLDLAAGGRLAALPSALLAGQHGELLAPLRYLSAGTLPSAPAAPVADRRELAAGLTTANRSYGHPRAEELGRKLADPATRVVVTGQQPGLLGGPLYTLSKMLAASRWAAALEAAGQPAVAVFWVATEDHDFREVSTCTVAGNDGPLSFDLGADLQELMPVGMRTLGPGMATLLGELAAAMPGERYGAWLEAVGRWYRPDARFGEAFCRLMVHLLGGHCPLLLDAMLPAVKQAQRPWLRRLIAERRQVVAAVEAAEAAVTSAGFKLQVAPQPATAEVAPSPLFLLADGARQRIEWRGESSYGLRGSADVSSVDHLLAVVEDNPAIVSPGVLARPAIQDAILGTTLQLLGPGELSYMVQAAAVHRVLGLPGAHVTLRPQMLVLETRQLEWLQQLGLELGDLLGDASELEAKLARRAGADFVTPVASQVAELLDGGKAPVVELDASLERPWEKTREQVLKALEQLGGRVAAAAARRDEVQQRRLESLRQTCLPAGKLQERLIASAHFPGKYPDFADACWQQLDLDPRALQVVLPALPGGDPS